MSGRFLSWLLRWSGRLVDAVSASPADSDPIQNKYQRQVRHSADHLADTVAKGHATRSVPVPAAGMPAISDRTGGGDIPAVHHRGHPTRDIEAIIGIDFGTSSTKIVVRLPYEAGEPAFAVPAIESVVAEGHPDLWMSHLWLSDGAIFHLTAVAGARLLGGIKVGLMDGDQSFDAKLGRSSAVPSESLSVFPSDAATAFLALHICEAKRWFKDRQPRIVASGNIVWSYNFGFPAASLDNQSLRTVYVRCVAAAVDLSSVETMSLNVVREARCSLGNDSTLLLEGRRAALFPEIAAAVAGFAHSQRRDDGLYAMIDVGATTLDCCTFNLVATAQGALKCPIFEADVSRYGVEPWQDCANDTVRREVFSAELNRRPRSVIWVTRRCRYFASPRWDTALPLFLLGGGAASDVHRSMTESLNNWIRNNFKNGKGGVRILELPPPENLEYSCSPEKIPRLAVAVGLSLPADMIPTVMLPHEIDDAPAPIQRQNGDLYVDKSMV